MEKEKETIFTPSAWLNMYNEAYARLKNERAEIEEKNKNKYPEMAGALSALNFVLFMEFESMLRRMEELERAQK